MSEKSEQYWRALTVFVCGGIIGYAITTGIIKLLELLT